MNLNAKGGLLHRPPWMEEYDENRKGILKMERTNSIGHSCET